MSDSYYALDEHTVIEYVRVCPAIHDLLAPDEPLICEEIGDGNLNLIFRVRSERDRARSVIVKQALPYVRLVGESWPLSPKRAQIESNALTVEGRLCPDLVPRLYHYDPVLYPAATRISSPRSPNSWRRRSSRLPTSISTAPLRSRRSPDS